MLFGSKKIKQLTDLELIKKYQSTHNTQLVGELFKRYSHLVLGVSLKYLKNEEQAKDMVMQVFEKLMEDLKTNDIKNFKGWLHTVSRNHCLMYLRKHNKITAKTQDMDVVEPYISHEDNVEGVLEKEVQLNLLEQAIHQLKPEQKTCVELFYIKQQCYNEVAEQTGFSLKQVKSYIQNGKRNLKIILSQNNEFVTK